VGEIPEGAPLNESPHSRTRKQKKKKKRNVDHKDRVVWKDLPPQEDERGLRVEKGG